MSAAERRKALLDYLEKNRTGYTSVLCAEMNVSAMTIRRDFEAMAKQGLVTLVRGGAALNHGAAVLYSLNLRQAQHPEEKQRIAAHCASIVEEGASVFIDCGSTAERIAAALRGRRNITVMTASLDAAQVLGAAEGMRLIMAPGVYQSALRGFSGQMTVDFMSRFRIDYLFLGANGLDCAHGLTSPDYTDAETKRALIHQARHVIVAADHTKIGRDYFERIARLPEIEQIVTDNRLDAALADDLRAGGTQVALV